MRMRILFLLKREITNWFPLQITTDDNLNSSASIPLLYPDCLLCLKNITLLYKDIFYKTIEAEIYEILRINPRLRFWKGYNLCWKSVNTIQFFYGRCPWSIRVQIHGWRHAKLVFFVLFNMARGFENVCEIQFRIKASEILEKSSTRGNYNRKKNGEKGTKKLLSTLECLNYKKSSQLDSCHRVSSLWDIRRFAKCFRHYSALSKKRRLPCWNQYIKMAYTRSL